MGMTLAIFIWLGNKPVLNDKLITVVIDVLIQGETVEEGTTNFGVNVAGFNIHSAIHAARPDLKCVIHLHTPNIVAVSTYIHDTVENNMVRAT